MMDDRTIDLWVDDFTKNRKQAEKDTGLAKLVNNIIEGELIRLDYKSYRYKS